MRTTVSTTTLKAQVNAILFELTYYVAKWPEFDQNYIKSRLGEIEAWVNKL